MSFSPSDVQKNQASSVVSIREYVNLPWDSACKKRNFDMLRHLVEHDSKSINYQNSEGITLLMIAAADSSDARGVRLLLENGAKTGICDDEGRMALHFAANSGNVELLQYVLEHTEKSSIEQWFKNIPRVLKRRRILHALVGCAIHSGNVKCLEILLSSDKLSRSILQAPFIKHSYMYPPVAYVFSHLVRFTDKTLNSYLQLLLNHKITSLDEFYSALQVKWPLRKTSFCNPFSKILASPWPFQQHYLHWLNENNVTIDYCLQCNHDNTQPFLTFTNYEHFYKPVINLLIVMNGSNLEALKLIMYNSAILEPDELIIQYVAYYSGEWGRPNGAIFKYLISLKPIYYNLVELRKRTRRNELSWYPYSTVGEEFSKSTLQQLCRTTIRHQIRQNSTVNDNLRNFRRAILDLPLPISLKEFLLFKRKKMKKVYS